MFYSIDKLVRIEKVGAMVKKERIEAMLAKFPTDRLLMAQELSRADQQILRRLVQQPHSPVVRIMWGMYARTDWYSSIDPYERHRLMITSYLTLHPDAALGGISALVFRGIPKEFVSYALLERLCLAQNSKRHSAASSAIDRVVVRDQDIETFQGVRCATISRALIDCARMHSALDTQGLFDVALRECGAQAQTEIAACTQSLKGHKGISRAVCALTHANPLAENGGESKCRIQFLRAGAQSPELQIAIQAGSKTYRLDFAWNTRDGYIAIEFDGKDKYAKQQSAKIVQADQRRCAALFSHGVIRLERIVFAQMMDLSYITDLLHKLGVPITKLPKHLQPTTDTWRPCTRRKRRA